MHEQLNKNIEVLKELQSIYRAPLQSPTDNSLPAKTNVDIQKPAINASPAQDETMEFCLKLMNRKVGFIVAMFTMLSLLLTVVLIGLQAVHLVLQPADSISPI